jgi:C1A family cysteine protease
MKAIFALSVLAAAASALTFKEDPFWKAYKSTFGKTYQSDAEESRRYAVFNENMQNAAKFNAMDDLAEYGMTVVSDRFPEEIFSTGDFAEYEGLEMAPAPTAEQILAAPASYDARQQGLIPAVRDQGQCGSCWAFSTIATVSGSYAKKHGGSPPVLSEQQLVDCDTVDGGCNGGLAANGLNYCKTGVMLNSDYPYRASAGSCRFDSSKVKAKVTAVYKVNPSVDAMKDAVYSNGIISVRVNANKVQSYHGGIITSSGCPATPNHAVNVVGWGTSGSTPYWIVRNSWGASWGESGYFRIVSGENACGIEGWPVKATVA